MAFLLIFPQLFPEFAQSGETAYHEGDQSSSQVPDEEEEEEEEYKDEEAARDRFRSERNSSVPLKSNRQSYGDIPETLGNRFFFAMHYFIF